MSIKNVHKKLDKKMINAIRRTLKKADKIVVGAGSGLSSSAGLNYSDTDFFKSGFAPFYAKGYETMVEVMTDHWNLTEGSARRYWGYWAHHIQNVYHAPGGLSTYDLLYDIIKDKDYFIITTNGDGQFFKGDFDSAKVFAMQGNYGKFQCQHACHNHIYDNAGMIKKMLDGFNKDTLEIRVEDIPKCPKCGGLMSPNLRMDHYFVEGDALNNREAYVSFINGADERTVFLELGVGYNTPTIIKNPFQEMAKVYDATLIRINKGSFEVPDMIEKGFISAQVDIHTVLMALKSY